jgi:glycosyltransferase involved in cell wall biosynthesis
MGRATGTSAPRLIIDGRRLAAGRTGVGRYLETLLAGWAESGPPLPDTRVILHDPAGLDRVPAGGGIRAEVAAPGLPGLAWERFGLGRRLRPGDVLFAPTNLLPPGWRGPTVLVLFDALLEARPGDFPVSARLRFRGRYRLAARRAGRVVVPSEATARDASRHYGVPPERIRVIYPAVEPRFRPRDASDPDVRAARRALGLGESRFWLVLGKRSRRRNVPAVLEAFARHRARFPDDRLVLAGPASEPVRGPGLIDAGHVGEDVLCGLLSSAAGLLYLSEMEGFGLPVAEAMASGCPVLTLRRGALIESGGDAAVFLDDPEPGAIASAMGRLVADGAWREGRVRRGLAHAARFDRGSFAGAVAEEVRAAVPGRRNLPRISRIHADFSEEQTRQSPSASCAVEPAS